MAGGLLGKVLVWRGSLQRSGLCVKKACVGTDASFPHIHLCCRAFGRTSSFPGPSPVMPSRFQLSLARIEMTRRLGNAWFDDVDLQGKDV